MREATEVLLKWMVDRSFVDIALASNKNEKQDCASPQRIQALRTTYNGGDAMKINGINHLAIVSSGYG